MDKNTYFFKQAEFMLRLLQFVAKEKCFALKGGTAINFFVRDMPRISVDIDLTYIPLEDRKNSLINISDALKRIILELKKSYKNIQIQEKRIEDRTSKIFVKNHEGVQVTIEPNEIIRGSVFPVKTLSVSNKVKETFEMSSEIQVLSLADLYGGKICAALDRQHPRDLFDIKILLEHEGITEDVRSSFIIYLAGHDRPMHELLNPSLKDVHEIYEKEFSGMTSVPVAYDELIAARKECLETIKSTLTIKEKEFLLSIKMGDPQWNLINVQNIHLLPSLQWKILNIKKMSPQKNRINVDKLKDVLKL